MEALEVLIHDHRRIEEGIDRALAALSPLDVESLAQWVEYVSLFVDRVHHAKEDAVLLPHLLERASEDDVDRIREIELLHRATRSQATALMEIAALAHRDDAPAKHRLEDGIRELIDILRRTITAEETFLFPLATALLPASLDGEILRRFSDVRERRVADESYGAWYAHPPASSPVGIPAAASKPPRKPEPRAVSGRRSDGRALGATTVLFDDGTHRNLRLHDFGKGLLLQANQYLIVDDGVGMILDPGGPKVFPEVLGETRRGLGAAKLRHIFLSHQDPDIATALNAWLVDTDADAWVSALWLRFLPHFGIDRLLQNRLRSIPDEGMIFRLGSASLSFLAAHWLHSCGNFQVWDPRSKILFSGDLGSSTDVHYEFAEDFGTHEANVRSFHQRYMASRSVAAAWAKMVRPLDIEMIAPQHGAVMRGRPIVRAFIDWCEATPCGFDRMADTFRLPSE